jgi:ribosomal protein L37AE/L43A
MPSHVASYNAEVLSYGCPKCGVPSLKRCSGAIGYVTLCHNARLALAGYRWDRQVGLVKEDAA